jgi:RNase P/RNase MRP subunit POP5
MKKYVFQITIEEGSNEFWEQIEREESTGCEDVRAMLLECLGSTGLDDAEVKLVQYTNK